MAGIEPAAPGFRTIDITPSVVGDLTSAGADQSTPLGRVASSWERDGERF